MSAYYESANISAPQQAHFRVFDQHTPHHLTCVFGVQLTNGGKLIHTLANLKSGGAEWLHNRDRS